MEWWNTVVPSAAYVGNSCKESTPHPNIRQYTDTRCQPAPACARWRGATVTYRPATGLHPPPSVEMQFPLFLPEKLLRVFPRHVPQIKTDHPTAYVCEVKPRRCRHAHILDLGTVYVPTHPLWRCERDSGTSPCPYSGWYVTGAIRESSRELRRSVDLSRKSYGSYDRHLSHPLECRRFKLSKGDFHESRGRGLLESIVDGKIDGRDVDEAKGHIL